MNHYPGQYESHESHDSLDELRDLLASYEAGGLTDVQDARLQELAVESEASWNLYLQRMFMYATIHREQRQSDQPPVPPTAPIDIPEPGPLSTPSTNSIFPLLDMESDLLSSGDNIDAFGASKNDHPRDAGSGGFWGQINFSFVPGLIMVIASALILSAVVVLPIYWSTHTDDAKWRVAARITRTLDCRWGKEHTWLRQGTFLERGQLLDLEVGLAELEFASGTRVVLQGPTRFVVTNDNLSRLDYGQLAARVPDGAEGFTVRTPGMDVVDLGTEFGVAVNALGQTDVQVFKGVVRAEVLGSASSDLEELATTKIIQSKPEQNKAAPERPKKIRKKILLKKNDAIRFQQETDKIVRVPVREKQFIRDLDRDDGITSKMIGRVVNPSFEVPDIRKVPEYQSKHGCTPSYPIVGWRTSDRDPKAPKVAMYQISPYTSMVEGSNVGPGASDGRQVATITLDAKPAKAKAGALNKDVERRSNWIFQSIGVVAPGDIGKTLKLSVDAGPRASHNGSPQGKGMVFAGFALGVTETQSGTGIGLPASFVQRDEVRQLHRLEAKLPITVELAGQELSIVLAASDNGTIDTVDQYHFDNVQLTVEE